MDLLIYIYQTMYIIPAPQTTRGINIKFNQLCTLQMTHTNVGSSQILSVAGTNSHQRLQIH